MVFIKVDKCKDSFTSWSNGLVKYWFGETWKILRTSSCPTLVGILHMLSIQNHLNAPQQKPRVGCRCFANLQSYTHHNPEDFISEVYSASWWMVIDSLLFRGWMNMTNKVKCLLMNKSLTQAIYVHGGINFG